MGAGEFSRESVVKDLGGMVAAERVFSDAETLKKYAQDTSRAPSRMPDVVVKVHIYCRDTEGR